MPQPLTATGMRARRGLSVALQLCVVAVANIGAFALRFDGDLPDWAITTLFSTLPWLVAIRALAFMPFRLYEGLWRYTSVWDLRNILFAICASTIAFGGLNAFVLHATYPLSIHVIDAALLILLMGGLRLSRRLVGELRKGRSGRRVLIYGAGDAGDMVVRAMRAPSKHDYNPIGFVDDDPSKRGRSIQGVRVLGGRLELPQIIELHRPDEVLIALDDAGRDDSATLREIVRALEPFKIDIKIMPRVSDIIDGHLELGQIRSLNLEDLLARAPVKLDDAPIRRLIRGRRVLVTGAGGSIGSELCRQIARLDPATLVLLDRYENGLHAVRLDLEDQWPAVALQAVIADVTDKDRVREVLASCRPEIVFHAAAHKHVPLMEENPSEAIKNNVGGTRVLADAAAEAGVGRFIFISTDKAVNPTSVMGASKRAAELVVQAHGTVGGTSFATVRFGNVLGSNGSVIPRFVEQIRNGGPVTVTHPDMRRFFMLIPEAVLLVLHAAAQSSNGAVYVLEMGEQIKMVDVARNLIRLSGFVPDEDIQIVFTGLRPGEKLSEELVGPNELACRSSVPKILCVTNGSAPPLDLAAKIRHLESQAFEGNARGIMASLRDLIPEYDRRKGRAAEAPGGPTPRAVAFENVAGILGLCCPSCRQQQIQRSRARGVGERLRRRWDDGRLFRCRACGWRGWLVPLEYGSPMERTVAPALSSGESAVDARDDLTRHPASAA